ncbi:MAG TPA: GyrI-like domain-containing protein [Candidatus Heimdallarchaeota archaeon]|nr:GyrI-like domain-containing protein [Candidatus Heimdallarchaeota archaeon]
MQKATKLSHVFILIVFVACLVWAHTQDISQYEKLKDPQIRKMPDKVKMLVVEKKGDPNVVAGMAFSTLFSTFFEQPGVKMAPPRARWLNAPADPRNEWMGLYALPLPESVETLRSQVEGVKIDYWDYGEVAEILHIGAYSEETPTIEKLFAFIAEQGYEIAGPHEEEYLRGPESGTDTSKYMTIIRYQVRKR